MKLKDAKLDVARIEDGVEFEYADGWVWTIARINNKRAQKRLQSDPALKGLAGRRRIGGEERQLAAFRKMVADTIALGWKGLEEDNGKEIPFTPKKALEIFEDEETRHVLDWVLECAQSEEDFRKEAVEEAVGNLQGS